MKTRVLPLSVVGVLCLPAIGMLRRIAALLALLAVVLPASASVAAARELMPGVTYRREVQSVRGQRVVVHVVTAPKPGGLYHLEPVLGDGSVTWRSAGFHHAAPSVRFRDGCRRERRLRQLQTGLPVRHRAARRGAARAADRAAAPRSASALDGLLRLARVGFFGTWGHRRGGRQAPDPAQPPAGGLGRRPVHAELGRAERRRRGMRSTSSLERLFLQPRPTST